MFPTTGSVMTAAMVEPVFAKSASTAARSFQGRVSVCLARSAGTPGESGRPSVSTPEPAFTRSGSPAPW
jgi:hypothetical protein